jgi:CheY-like chemotaxis protein
LRSELADEYEPKLDRRNHTADPAATSQELHKRNNQLNSITLQIQIARKLLSRGQYDQAMSALEGSLAKLQTLDEQAPNSEQPKFADTSSPTGTRKALLVEDDANERQLMSTILQMCGFEVDAVEDGQAAIEYLQTQQRPDCVLMDMQMPRMSGPEAISKIRQEIEFADVPIYGVSGLPRQEANVPIGDRGVTGWFAKPVDATKLVRQIFEDASLN